MSWKTRTIWTLKFSFWTQQIKNWSHATRKLEEVTPLAADGRILDGIKLERELLAPLKNMSQNVVDTTELTPRELRKTIAEQFSDQEQAQSFRIEVMSFGFKYGIPIDADLVFDVRFCQIHTTCLNSVIRQVRIKPVYDYVMNHEESESFISTYSP